MSEQPTLRALLIDISLATLPTEYRYEPALQWVVDIHERANAALRLLGDCDVEYPTEMPTGMGNVERPEDVYTPAGLALYRAQHRMRLVPDPALPGNGHEIGRVWIDEAPDDPLSCPEVPAETRDGETT